MANSITPNFLNSFEIAEFLVIITIIVVSTSKEQMLIIGPYFIVSLFSQGYSFSCIFDCICDSAETQREVTNCLLYLYYLLGFFGYAYFSYAIIIKVKGSNIRDHSSRLW